MKTSKSASSAAMAAGAAAVGGPPKASLHGSQAGVCAAKTTPTGGNLTFNACMLKTSYIKNEAVFNNASFFCERGKCLHGYKIKKSIRF